MTKQEWINKDLNFYHITHTRNLDNIYRDGLNSKDNRGICVVRSDNELIVKYITEMMLFTDDDLDYSIIKISPRKIQLLSNELVNDHVEEITSPLHNYILRRNIIIMPEDVIRSYKADPLGILNLKEYEDNLLQKIKLVYLE